MVNESRQRFDGNSGSQEPARDPEIYRTQIFRFVEGDRILDTSDMLSTEPRRNKIALTIVEFDGSFRCTRRVRHYVDVDDFKLVCHDILAGGAIMFHDRKGSIHSGYTEARTLTIKRAARAKEPCTFQIDNGIGQPQPDGTVAMREVTGALAVSLSRWEARKLALAALDYIRQWETVNFRRRQEARTVRTHSTTEALRAPLAPAA
jgi:hypothetical protein